ncbi:uncharacterized protein LOC131383367 [Hylobates moloch]|uniref:uncharacterized protein LOC131383367 n=1 Tax=Hylobates moloch TaxID=81572 RepID=UPI00267539AE|nr:uncharacterized protein LOC131383367 [Hylobates moloch]
MIVEILRLKDVDLVLHQTAELAVWGDPACMGYVKLENNVIHSTFTGNSQSTEYYAKHWRTCQCAKHNPCPEDSCQKGYFKYYPDLTTLEEMLNFASVPTSISRPLSPSPRDSPTPWARAHPYTHTRRRACARPRASSRGVSSAPQQIPALPGAATHTGFQPPRGVLCLLQRRRRRRQRERRLQPGRVSQLRARDRVREKQRRRRTPRLGGAAPRPAPQSAQRVASAPHTAAPGFHPPALHPFSSSLGGLRSAAGRKLSSPPSLRWVLLLFVTVPSRGDLGHLGQVFVGGSAPCLAQREVKEALGQPDSAAARVQSPRLGRWTPAASPPLRIRHVRASHGRGPSQTTPRPPPARPQPPHRLDTRGSRVLIG